MTRTQWRSTTRATSGLLALALALLCAVAIATSPTAAADTSSSDGMPMSHAATAINPLNPAVGTTPTSEPNVNSPAILGGMCNGVCATHSAATCAFVVVLAGVSLLGLLLTRRRNTSLGVMARLPTRPRRIQTDRQRPPRWTVLTLTEMCVLRV